MIRHVKEARKMLAHPVTLRKWSTLKRKAVFGFTANAVRRQLATMDFCGYKVTCHRKIHPAMNRVEARIRKAEAKHDWPEWTPARMECFNWRTIRGGTSLSRHAHAIAFDIDPKHNGYFTRYDPHNEKQTTNIPVHVLNAFLAEGFTLGIEWNAPLDVMHIQYA